MKNGVLNRSIQNGEKINMGKTYSTIYLDKEVIQKAKDIGLNISKTCENALKDSIRRLEAPNHQNTTQPVFGEGFSQKASWWGRGDLNSQHSGITTPEHRHSTSVVR